MINYNFVPETLDWCTKHYVPPIKSYVSCPNFGMNDGMNGKCWHCMEMTPYQFEMCHDESWLRSLMLYAYKGYKTREEAAEFIENHKQERHRGNIIETLYELHKQRKENDCCD